MLYNRKTLSVDGTVQQMSNELEEVNSSNTHVKQNYESKVFSNFSLALGEGDSDVNDDSAFKISHHLEVAVTAE